MQMRHRLSSGAAAHGQRLTASMKVQALCGSTPCARVQSRAPSGLGRAWPPHWQPVRLRRSVLARLRSRDVRELAAQARHVARRDGPDIVHAGLLRWDFADSRKKPATPSPSARVAPPLPRCRSTSGSSAFVEHMRRLLDPSPANTSASTGRTAVREPGSGSRA